MSKRPTRPIAPVEIFEFMFAKKINKSKYLREHFGGNWKYDGMATWWCDDNKRWVSKTSSCSCDDVCNHPPRYIMYQEPFIVYRAIDWKTGD